MTMQEAFRRAKEESPKSPIVQKVNAEWIRLEEERRFALLREQFKSTVGYMWFGTRIDPAISKYLEHNRIRIPIEQKKRQWTYALTILKDRPSEQRIELLRALASGMQLSEDNATPAVDAKYRKFFRFAPLRYSGDNPLGVSFTRPSVFFIEAIGDMSGHSREQQEKFREFMIKKSGLTGEVGLPQLFPGVSRWIDRGNSRIPS